MKDAAIRKLFNAIEVNVTLSEFSTIMQDIYHSITSGTKIESGDLVARKIEPDQKKDVHTLKKMTPRGFSSKK